MTTNVKNYFRYLPIPPNADLWGVSVSAAGRTAIPPGRAYPPAVHPADHGFSWAQGRVLEALQIVLITQGSGTFETAVTKEESIEAGSAFMLFPGIWHRYRPLAAVGWNESWIEVSGPVIERLIEGAVLSPRRPVLPPQRAVALESALEAVHQRVQLGQAGLDPELSARALAAVAAWSQAQNDSGGALRLRSALERGLRYLTEHSTEPVSIPALARKLGVAYSHFRDSFRRHIGYAPWQYVIHLRLLKGKQLLMGTDATLDEIAERVGFSSGFHFSSAFKNSFGESPRRWRNRLMKNNEIGPGPAR
jgi:AraC-like DNA-binding protein